MTDWQPAQSHLQGEQEVIPITLISTKVDGTTSAQFSMEEGSSKERGIREPRERVRNGTPALGLQSGLENGSHQT